MKIWSMSHTSCKLLGFLLSCSMWALQRNHIINISLHYTVYTYICQMMHVYLLYLLYTAKYILYCIMYYRCIIMYFHVLSLYYHVLSCILMYYDVLSCIVRISYISVLHMLLSMVHFIAWRVHFYILYCMYIYILQPL